MTARSETYEMKHKLATRGIVLEFDEVNMLRKAQMTLHRWSELECGDGNNYASWAIERDEKTGLPFMCTYPHEGKPRRHRVADREKGALARVDKLCKAHGLHYYHQGDPRGCSLYVSIEPLTDANYNNGIACC